MPTQSGTQQGRATQKQLQLNACQRRAARDTTRLIDRPWTLGCDEDAPEIEKKNKFFPPRKLSPKKSVCPMKHCNQRAARLSLAAVGGPIRRHVQPRFFGFASSSWLMMSHSRRLQSTAAISVRCDRAHKAQPNQSRSHTRAGSKTKTKTSLSLTKPVGSKKPNFIFSSRSRLSIFALCLTQEKRAQSQSFARPQSYVFSSLIFSFFFRRISGGGTCDQASKS